MIKMLALIKRRPDLTHEEFCTYYEQKHAPLAARVIPDDVTSVIRHYGQNHALKLGSGTTEPHCDCVTEFEFDDLAGLERWTTWYMGDGGRVLRDDEENFMDVGSRIILITEERPASIHSSC
ncbi:EthD domain-containing protein [Rhodococcus indonesiensis]